VSEPDRQGSRDRAIDDVLVAARADAPWAFERLYDLLAPSVAGYLGMHGARDPDEMTNEVMLGVFRGLDGFEGDAVGFRSWVFTIAHRRLIDDRRRRSARVETTDLQPQHEQVGGDAESEALDRMETDAIRELLEQLTEDQRAVILLRVVGDLSVEDTARVLGKRPGAIKMLQRRGLARLRRILETQGVTS
jgi:RNA polymerase sigma factor (sigma-70 family)